MSIGADRVQINRTSLKGQMKRSVFSKSIYIDIQIDCHSHTAAHCGEAIDGVCLEQKEFRQNHNGVFSGSKASELYLTIVGKMLPLYSPNRWFSEQSRYYDVCQEYHTIFDSPKHISAAPNYQSGKMGNLFQNSQLDLNCFKVELEMAIVVDLSIPYY